MKTKLPPVLFMLVFLFFICGCLTWTPAAGYAPAGGLNTTNFHIDIYSKIPLGCGNTRVCTVNKQCFLAPNLEVSIYVIPNFLDLHQQMNFKGIYFRQNGTLFQWKCAFAIENNFYPRQNVYISHGVFESCLSSPLDRKSVV